MYVVELVAPGTVNTMPEATLHATAAHARLRGNTAAGGYEEARQVFDELDKLGIGYDDVVRVLEEEGVAKFAASWHELLETIRTEMASVPGREAGDR
jgi:transaldolase